VALWAGWPFFVRGWRSVRTWHLNMFTLIALGVGAAYTYSVVALLVPRAFPATFQVDGNVPVYLRPPPSSPCSSCSANGSKLAPEAAPEAPSKRCFSKPLKRLVSCATVTNRKFRSSR